MLVSAAFVQVMRMNAIAWLAESNSLQTAWFGFVGVILGAAIVGGFSYAGVRRKEQADAAAESLREAVAVRRAARLIGADLLVAEVAARTCVEKKRWWVKDRRLTSEAWQQYRDVIASKLAYREWLAVVVAALAVGDMQLARDEALKLQLAEMATDSDTVAVLEAANAADLDIADPSPAIDEAKVTLTEPMLRDIEAGIAALAPLMRGPAEES